MANRRMFSKEIIDSDHFLDMPSSAQNLYFHLAMRADDDGFVNSPKRIKAIASASDDDFKLLIAKQFIIPFESGICVIVHWRIHNYLRSDRYKETVYTAEKSLLSVKENGEYTGDSTIGIPSGIPTGNQRSTQYSIDKNSIGNRRNAPKRTRFTPPTPQQVKDYCTEKGYTIDVDHFVDYYTSNGWMVGKNKMKDWKAAARNARNWNRTDRTAVLEQPGADPVFVD